jgi:hypothetical protein
MLESRTGPRRILSAEDVRVNKAKSAVAATSAVCVGQPHVETREQGGVIREIIVTCSCGKNVVLQCDYGAARAVS